MTPRPIVRARPRQKNPAVCETAGFRVSGGFAAACQARAKRRVLKRSATLTSEIRIGTSNSGPMTVANASLDEIPKIATATAMASSKSLLAAVNETAVDCP